MRIYMRKKNHDSSVDPYLRACYADSVLRWVRDCSYHQIAEPVVSLGLQGACWYVFGCGPKYCVVQTVCDCEYTHDVVCAVDQLKFLLGESVRR